jgi:2-oxoglutarate ferredoxin oxidoreductase subunit alpha
MAGSDLPAVIINVQRGGPGLGGIQPSQADYWQATKATGHGDFQILVFAPSTVQEMVDLISHAFDTADKYRMPAMVLADGMLGQMMEPVELPEEGSAQLPEKEWAAKGHGGKRAHNIINSLYLTPEKLEELVKERFARYEQVKANEQMAEEYLTEDADIVLVAYGASSRVARSAVNKAREKGIKAGLVRPITLWPFPGKALKNIAMQDSVKAVVDVELSMGQMIDDVKIALEGCRPVSFVGKAGGVVPTPADVAAVAKQAIGR